MPRHAPAHAHYDHVGMFYNPVLGEVFIPSTVTFMDVRAGTSVISRSAKSDAVAQLQAMLNALKFRDSRGRPLVVDKLFGPNTEFSLKSAQAAIRARAPSTVMIDGSFDKATLLALEAMQAGKPLPGETVATVSPPSLPGVPPVVPPPVTEPSAPWWKSPWVLGGGVILGIAAVAALVGGDDTSAKT